MPAYNAERSIAESIQSALNQTGCEVEVIVVDDGSSDKTRDVVLAIGDRRVRCIQQKNAGPAVARNRGVEAAKHEWIAFLDADDLWQPQKLARQLETAHRTNAAIVYTLTRNFGNCDDLAEVRHFPDGPPRGQIFEMLLLDNVIGLSSVMIHRRVFLDHGGFRSEFRGTEDWDLWLRLSAAGQAFEVVPELLTLYRWQEDSLSRDHYRMKALREKTIRSALRLPGRPPLSPSVIRLADANALATAAHGIAAKDPSQAFLWFLQSLRKWPFLRERWTSTLRVFFRMVALRTANKT